MRFHGTVRMYREGCRCESCCAAKRRNRLGVRTREPVDRRLLAEALQELFPFGLTDDCPARRRR